MERVCGRHVGLLRAVLRMFMIAFKGMTAVTRDLEAEFTASQLVNMGRGSDLRALPRLAGTPAEETAILAKVALADHGGLQLNGAEVAVPRLLSAGVLDLETPGLAAPEVLRFSSPAMRAHALINLSVKPELALPATALSDAGGFVRAAVNLLRSSELADADEALKISLLERRYQMSFYRLVMGM
jgi:hypothetical protein